MRTATWEDSSFSHSRIGAQGTPGEIGPTGLTGPEGDKGYTGLPGKIQ